MKLNTVTVEGNLTRNADYKTTVNGVELLSFSIAHNQAIKNKTTGEWDQIAHFFDARAFGRIAGWHQDLSTGEPVLITGRLQQDTWQDKTTGQNRQRVVIIADEIRRLARRGDTASAPAPGTTTHTMMKPDAGEDVPF